MHINFRRTKASIAISRLIGVALLFSQLPSSAQKDCPPLTLPPVSIASWDADTAYEMTVRDLGGGQLRITIVGDILMVDAARFASLVRTVDKAPGNVAEVVLDARVVRILEPIALQSGMLRIFADTVSIEERGLVALTKAPGSATDGLEINATMVDVRSAIPIPLQLSVKAGSPRRVKIRAARLMTSAGQLQGAQAARTLWRRSANFDGIIPDKLPPEWEVDISDKGGADAIMAMQQPAAWPGYLAYKLRKHHSLAPFDKAHQLDLNGRIRVVRPLIEQLQRADVLMELDAVSLLMNRNIDRRGYGPAHVPSEDLVVAMRRFATTRIEAQKQLINLRTIIASAHQSPKLDVGALNTARSRIRLLNDAQEQTRAEVGVVFTDIAVLQAQGKEIDAAIVIERENSRKALEDLKKKQKDLDNIKLATTVVAVGASFVGTPAAGAAIATGVGVAGDLVYAHNAGKPMNVETLVTIGAKSAANFKKFQDAREAWDKHSENLSIAKQVFDGKAVTMKGEKKILTKMDAAKRVGDSAGDFAKKVKAVADGLGAIPKPDMMSQNGIEAENTELQRHLGRLVEVQRQLSEKAARLDGLQSALTADEAALAETRLVEQVLLELKPANDQEVMRWKTAALQLWARELQSLYQDAMDLRRSLFFETWKTPTLSQDVLHYPEEFTAYLAAGRYSPEAPNATSPIALTTAHLDNEIARHMAVLDGIARSVSDTWNVYQAERAAGAQPFFDQQEISSRESAPPSVKFFIEQVNAQIRRQIERPETRDNLQFTLLIPFDMTPPPTDLPERLLQAGVVTPKFENPTSLVGKKLMFDVTYRLAGEIKRNQQCAYVDLSVPGGNKTSVWRSSSDEIASIESKRAEAEQPLTFTSLRQSRAAPPARTLYFLSVIVGGSPQHGNWKNVPTLDSFTFWRRIVQ
ncbi:hypothetical protein [Massilia pseudoviolaceinigra]|uniref:hypothetical protein n=1 Tax=Massilia pseudoviolaceinigra TaxID=3057165 RepID=UPI002796BB20|nr:hypothetical protein [Massilia sp. CCM 9206]MDQ1918983.1 hypothetical protein [Massilia sp. CCM 9206]